MYAGEAKLQEKLTAGASHLPFPRKISMPLACARHTLTAFYPNGDMGDEWARAIGIFSRNLHSPRKEPSPMSSRMPTSMQ